MMFGTDREGVGGGRGLKDLNIMVKFKPETHKKWEVFSIEIKEFPLSYCEIG